MRPEDAPQSPVELACEYITLHVRRTAGPRWLQGPLPTPLLNEPSPPAVRLFAERRLLRIPEAVPRALIAWWRGVRRVELLFHVPTARDVLALQARGLRCVSLLDEHIDPAPHADGLAFAIHDLCHLEKFADPAQHTAQVGFFAKVHRALEDPRFRAIEEKLDQAWESDRDHVVADMNGSAVFLLLALKSKLKMAIRRSLARARGDASAPRGPMLPEEQHAYDAALETLLEALDVRGPASDAARALSSRGGAPNAETTLYQHLYAAGEAALASEARATDAHLQNGPRIQSS
jgi:hypothetical protein